MSSKKKLVLVDGSFYLYRAFHAMPPLTAPDGQATGVIYGVVNMLKALINQEKPMYFAVIFDAPGKTFRHDMYAEYKANRPPMPEDLVLQVTPLLELIALLGYPLIQIAGVEADDVIGSLATRAVEKDYVVLISTGDKDLMQLVDDNICLINTMNNKRFDSDGVKNKLGVFPQQVVDYLTLVGDTADNIPGVKGVGQKTATAWLEKYGDLDTLVTHIDELTGRGVQALRDGIEDLPLLSKLVSIKRTVKMELEIDALRFSPINTENLASKYKELGFKKWLDEIADEKPSVADEVVAQQTYYELILSEKALARWIERITNAESFAFGIETTNLNYMQAEIVGVAFSLVAGEAAYIPLAHDYVGVPEQLDRDKVLEMLRPVLEDVKMKKIGHNLKYERNVLANYGIELSGIAHDSMLESYVYNSVASRHNLNSLAKKYLDITTIHYEDVTGKGSKQKSFSQVELRPACNYSAEDVDISLRLHAFFSEQMQPLIAQQQVYKEIEIPLLSVISDIERKGVILAVDVLEAHSKELSEKIQAIERQAYDIVSYDFNLDSPQQIREILFEQLQLPVIHKTPKGEASTAENVLQELADKHELPSIILNYRGLKKLQSTYTDKMPLMVNPKTQRIHTYYHQATTATGRLSSSDPNLQNIPVRTEEGRRIRHAFVAAPYYRLLAADYSQIELRIMAHLSGDESLCYAFEQGKDIHVATAAEIFNIALDQVSPEQRRSAKAINFGLIYGMSAFGLSQKLQVNMTMAKQYLDTYFKRYPRVKEYINMIKEEARVKGYVETLFGRRLYLPDIQSRGHRRAHAERAAINAPMQGTAADIIKRAMIDLHTHLKKMRFDADIVMQVHDELLLEVAEQQVEQLTEICNHIMTSVVKLKVPLLVDIGVGDNWDEAH